MATSRRSSTAMILSLPFSQVPGDPSFRASAVNTVAIVPLLSTDKQGRETNSHSAQAFHELWSALDRYSHRQKDEDGVATGLSRTNSADRMGDEINRDSQPSKEAKRSADDLILVVPNSQLTRPGDWRYDSTPLKNFHWSHGCQRLHIFDGRPARDRMAHDRLLNSALSRDWIDLIPSRRTAAVVGVLNMQDCPDLATLHLAEQELQQWAERYSSPPYEVTAHGRSFARDSVVQRLFVYDSFDETCQDVDLAQSKLGSNLVAFPPSDDQHTHMMDLHLNVVVNDLAVGIFRTLETKIKESDVTAALEKGGGGRSPDTRVKTHSLLQPAKGGGKKPSASLGITSDKDEPVAAGNKLSVANIAAVVNPSNELASPVSSPTVTEKTPSKKALQKAKESTTSVPRERSQRRVATATRPQLLTPLDDVFDIQELSPRDAEATQKRNFGRREKYAADLSLLAGSPMDAYERYSRAAELCKESPDPLWYAYALEGCAAAHIAMGEAGGYNVDPYLENNFHLPEEIMTLANTGTADQSSRSNKQSTKRTMPTVVYALCEEALNILNRHVRLAPLHAELLLKLARYAAESEEGHLRCRWGEGKRCYAGDTGELRRWELTTVSKMKFQELRTKEGEDIIAQSSLRRCQKWVELMHRAVSTGALDRLSRVDVALVCARLCLHGLNATLWYLGPKTKVPRLLCMPRKAAFFSIVASESLARLAAEENSDFRPSTLWHMASQLYSSHSNDVGSELKSRYGWATIRASILHGLSQQENPELSESAAELLLLLLGELSANKSATSRTLEALEAFHMLDRAFVGESRVPSDEIDEKPDVGDTLSAMANRYSSFAKASTGATRSGFFSGDIQNASLLTVAQSKWADDDVFPPVSLPLVGSDVKERAMADAILSLNCVIPNIRRQASALEQKRCVEHIMQLRNRLYTLSSGAISAPEGFPSARDALSETVMPLRPPLKIISASIVKSESHLLLERTKAAGFSSKGVPSVMSTFFNPFDKKKKEEGKRFEAILVAEGEERELLVDFSNDLSIPLDIPSCQLEFGQSEVDRVKAPALSFAIPAKAKKFGVNFPFIVSTAGRNPQTGDEGGDRATTFAATPNLATSLFEAQGLNVTCMGRSFFIPFVGDLDGSDSTSDVSTSRVPVSASIYQRSPHSFPEAKKLDVAPRVETVPAQPNLRVSFTTSQTAIEDGTTVPVHLSDGEIFTIPSFRLQNDLGPSGLGAMERLQIIGVGLPGLTDEVLFDTDALAAAKEEDEDELTESDSDEEAFEQVMADDGLPPLKIRAFCEGLSLESINDRNRSHSVGSIVTFQVAATHDMGTQLANGGNVRIRFRYRGVSPHPATEIWRKREVSLRIVRVKGPRISSLSFRPDLIWGSSFSELCGELAQQKAEHARITRPWDESKIALERMKPGDDNSLETSVLNRVGVDEGVHVCSDDMVVLMAVANETNSTIVLSNRKGLVGGFQGSPMPTVRVTSGVSVKIPVVIPRISRVSDKEGSQIDVVAELVQRTALKWESVREDTDLSAETLSMRKRSSMIDNSTDAANRKVRRGHVRIPSRCLREIMAEHHSFVSRICKPPVSVHISVGGSESSELVEVSPGISVHVLVKVRSAEWVPADVLLSCSITMEFCCARKGAAGGMLARDEKHEHKRRPYVWCGLVRRKVRSSADEQTHSAKIAFLDDGNFVISACARIAKDGSAKEETWWAPLAQNVTVTSPKH